MCYCNWQLNQTQVPPSNIIVAIQVELNGVGYSHMVWGKIGLNASSSSTKPTMQVLIDCALLPFGKLSFDPVSRTDYVLYINLMHTYISSFSSRRLGHINICQKVRLSLSLSLERALNFGIPRCIFPDCLSSSVWDSGLQMITICSADRSHRPGLNVCIRIYIVSAKVTQCLVGRRMPLALGNVQWMSNRRGRSMTWQQCTKCAARMMGPNE